MSPGQQFEAGWRRMMQALQPLQIMFAQQKLSRAAALSALHAARRELDGMEATLTGKRNGK